MKLSDFSSASFGSKTRGTVFKILFTVGLRERSTGGTATALPSLSKLKTTFFGEIFGIVFYRKRVEFLQIMLRRVLPELRNTREGQLVSLQGHGGSPGTRADTREKCAVQVGQEYLLTRNLFFPFS